MRAIAVLLVVAYHAGVPFLPGGYVGVDVFFVLSGFLITAQLLKELSTTGTVNLLAFYARRARRLIPAAVVVIVSTVIISALLAPPQLVGPVLNDARASLLLVPNLLFADRATDYLAESSPSPLLHFWSLGVEEQFYIVWPVALLGLWLASRPRPRILILGVCTLIAASFSASVLVTEINEPWGFFAPWTRAWEFGFGAAIAAFGIHERRTRPFPAAVLAWAGLLSVIGAATAFSSGTVFPGYAAAVPVMGAAAAIVASPSAGRFGPGALLGWAPMQFLGRISYSLYLVHWPLLVLPVVTSAMGEALTLPISLALAALAVPVAWALHHGVENPIRRWPIKSGRGQKRLLVGGALAVAVSLVMIHGVSGAVADRPLATGDIAGPPPSPASWPLYSPVVPRDIIPALADASADLPSIYATGCHLALDAADPRECLFGDAQSTETTVLFGDSHAAQWFPALEAIASTRGLRLESHTKSNCPPFPVEIMSNGVVDIGCNRWREQVVRQLERTPPTTVVVSAFGHYNESGVSRVTRDQWADAARALVSRLAAGSRVFVIADTPRFPRTPALCLSANVDDVSACDFPRARALDEAFAAAQRRAVEAAGGVSVDMNDFLCEEVRCGTVTSNLLMYRDDHHIATRVALALSGELETVMYASR